MVFTLLLLHFLKLFLRCASAMNAHAFVSAKISLIKSVFLHGNADLIVSFYGVNYVEPRNGYRH
jgi:hypothetical protein